MEFRFNQTIYNSLTKKMNLEEIIIPQDLERKDSYNKERSIQVKCYKGEKIEKIVLTEMTASGGINNNNGLIYPGENYDFPIFDFMFGVIGEILLAATEFYPLRKDEGHLEKYISPMKELYQEASKIPDPMENPFDWIKEFSSGYGFFLGSTEEHLLEIEGVFRRYLELWIGYVEEAKPIADPALKNSASDFKKRFRKVFHENDPGQDSLYRNFGKDWTEKYYREVLY